MFAPRNLELEDADPMVSLALAPVSVALWVHVSRVTSDPPSLGSGVSSPQIAPTVCMVLRPKSYLCPTLTQVNPPESPSTASPLQGSLHSDGSSGGSGGNAHDDFVMVDFVSFWDSP